MDKERSNGKMIIDLPSITQLNDSDVMEGQSTTTGSFKVTVQKLYQFVLSKFSVPVATNLVVGGIKSSNSDKQINVIADGTGIVNNVPSVTDMNNLLSGKVDVVQGKQLSQEDFTSGLKTKLDGIQYQAEKNIINSISVNGTDILPVDGNVDLNIQANVDYITDSDINSLF